MVVRTQHKQLHVWQIDSVFYGGYYFCAEKLKSIFIFRFAMIKYSELHNYETINNRKKLYILEGVWMIVLFQKTIFFNIIHYYYVFV